MTGLQILSLGPFQILDGEEVVETITAPKARALLAYLAARHRQPHSRQELAALLWPDHPEPQARQNLRQILHRLQKSLPPTGDDLLLVRWQTVQLNAQATALVDVATFTDELAAVHNHDHDDPARCAPCCRRLAAVISLYRGDFLADLDAESPAFDDWVQLERSWLRGQAQWALDVLVRHARSEGDFESVAALARQLLAIDPLLEEAHRQLMEALAHLGQRAQALAHFSNARRLFQEELGMEPGAETFALVEAIRADAIGRGAASASTGPAPELTGLGNQLPLSRTPFVGRARELGQAEEWLADPHCHLVTLVGTDGVGKSRLALQLARRQALAYAHGARCVSLAGVTTPAMFRYALAAALPLPGAPLEARADGQRLLAHLQAHRMLLILDQYQAPWPGLELVVELLQTAPGLQFLITAPQPLKLRAEWLVDVQGLPGGAPVSGERRHLFFQLLAASQERGSPGAQADRLAEQVGELCQGNPLAMELAAGAASRLSLPQLQDELVRWRKVHPADPVAAAFECAWASLDGERRRRLMALAVFPGGFTPAAASTVAQARPEDLRLLVKTMLAHPVGRMLPSGPLRLAFHDRVWRLLAEKLATHPEAWEQAHRRLCRFLTRQMSLLGGVLSSGAPGKAPASLAAEWLNLCHARDWAHRHWPDGPASPLLDQLSWLPRND